MNLPDADLWVWPGKAEDLGDVAATACPFCHNTVYLRYVRSLKSVRLYFVPVVPYGSDEFLLCPICTRGLQVSKEQRSAVEATQAATSAFRGGRMAENAYRAQVGRFWAAFGVNPAGHQVLFAAPAGSVVTPTTTGPVPPTATPLLGSGSPWINHLRELDELHTSGALTDEQYRHAKRRVLGQP